MGYATLRIWTGEKKGLVVKTWTKIRISWKKKGVAVKTMGDETLRICRELVDDVVLCDTDEICVAIKDIFEDTRQVFFKPLNPKPWTLNTLG